MLGKRHTIVLPLPVKSLSPNARPHWAAKAKATRAYRTSALVAAREAKIPTMTAAAVRCRFFMATNRNRDTDNLIASMKAAFDGLADAGVVANDRLFQHLPPEVLVDKTNPRVEVDIEAREVMELGKEGQP